MIASDRCPGCGSADVTVVERVTPEELVRGYAQPWLGVDVSGLFKNTAAPVQLCSCRPCTLKWYAGAPSGDSSFYEQLQKKDWYYQDQKPEFAFASEHIPSRASVLEV